MASTCLLRYTFEFEGMLVPFGRPEVVATMPEYRNRGLIRAIFQLIHGKSQARGDLVQGITGIQNYYRQFGYEYAVPEGVGLTVYFPAIPSLKAGAPEPYTLRQATVEDLPLLRLEEREQVGAAITTPITESYYRWSMEGVEAERYRGAQSGHGAAPVGVSARQHRLREELAATGQTVPN